jgi:hypothetical protein
MTLFETCSLLLALAASLPGFYALHRSRSTDSHGDTEAFLKASPTFGPWLVAQVETSLTKAISAAIEKVSTDAARIANAVFDARLLSLLERGTFVSSEQHEALYEQLSARIEELARSIAPLQTLGPAIERLTTLISERN